MTNPTHPTFLASLASPTRPPSRASPTHLTHSTYPAHLAPPTDPTYLTSPTPPASHDCPSASVHPGPRSDSPGHSGDCGGVRRIGFRGPRLHPPHVAHAGRS